MLFDTTFHFYQVLILFLYITLFSINNKITYYLLFLLILSTILSSFISRDMVKENQNYIIKETSWRVIVLLPILATLNYINLELYGFFASFVLIFILFVYSSTRYFNNLLMKFSQYCLRYCICFYTVFSYGLLFFTKKQICPIFISKKF